MRTRLLIATLLVALVAGACGDDDLGGLTPDPNGSTDSGDPFGDDSDNPFGAGDLTGFTNEECVRIVLAWSQAATFGADPAQTAEELADLAEAVPPEIAADFAIFSQALAAYNQALSDAGIDFNNPSTYSSPEAQAALVTAAEEFDDAAVQEASDRIGDYLDENCTPEE